MNEDKIIMELHKQTSCSLTTMTNEVAHRLSTAGFTQWTTCHTNITIHLYLHQMPSERRSLKGFHP